MDDCTEPVQHGDNRQFEHQEQELDMANGFESDGIREGNVVTNSVDHRATSSGKLFVGGVSWDTTEANFTSYFSNFGELTDSVIMLDRLSGRRRGFGFVTFADPTVADRVLEVEHVIDGRTVEVKRTIPREDMESRRASKTRKIFVGGLPPSLSNDELREYFSTYGAIADCRIMIDHETGRSRGFGFVTFDNKDAVEQIFSLGEKHELGGKQVEVKRAEPSGGDSNGNATTAYGGFGNPTSRHDGYNYVGGNYCLYDAYGVFGGSYTGFYSHYGGYLYGFGYGGDMYGGGAGYGGNGYGMLRSYGGINAYNHYGSMADRYHTYRTDYNSQQ